LRLWAGPHLSSRRNFKLFLNTKNGSIEEG
jgi:hypothetical protein